MSAEPAKQYFRWILLYLLNVVIATIGVLFTVGLIANVVMRPILDPLFGNNWLIRLGVTPYHPLYVLAAWLGGWFSHIRFRGSYRYWVWMLPAANLVRAAVQWKSLTLESWHATGIHFFGPIEFPFNRDQLDTTGIVYTSIVYAVAAFLQSKYCDRRYAFRFRRQ